MHAGEVGARGHGRRHIDELIEILGLFGHLELRVVHKGPTDDGLVKMKHGERGDALTIHAHWYSDSCALERSANRKYISICIPPH